MKNLILIFAAVTFFSFAANAQSVAGTYSNNLTKWEFIDTDVTHEYDYKGYNNSGKLVSIGFAFYSKKQGRFVVIFKRIDAVDDIGYAVCKLEGGSMNVKTLNPDGSQRWDLGSLKKQ